MRYNLVLIIVFIALLFLYAFVRNKLPKIYTYFILGLMMVVFFVPLIIPRNIFGKWNAISDLRHKKVREIIIEPSQPSWKVNLVGSEFIIANTKQIDSIVQLLENCEVYFPGHPSRIWECNIIFITSTTDTLKIKVEQTNNNGAVISTELNEWRRDEVGPLLEGLTGFIRPVYSDTSTVKY